VIPPSATLLSHARAPTLISLKFPSSSGLERHGDDRADAQRAEAPRTVPPYCTPPSCLDTYHLTEPAVRHYQQRLPTHPRRRSNASKPPFHPHSSYARQGSDGGASRTTGVDSDKLSTADKSLVLVVWPHTNLQAG
jgi:hypothetical protein